VLADGLAFARRVGNRQWERSLAGQVYVHYALGNWDTVLEHIPELLTEEVEAVRVALSAMLIPAVGVYLHRGELGEAKRIVDHLATLATSADAQERASFAAGQARLLLGNGDAAAAVDTAEAGLELREALGMTTEFMKELFVAAAEGAFALGDHAKVEEVLAAVEGQPPGRISQAYQAHASRLRARLAVERSQTDEAERRFKGAAGLFREIVSPFYLAVTQLEHGEWLVAQGRNEEAEPLLAEAREVVERLQATPWLERVTASATEERVTA
jgi:hypothetical protein